MPSGVMEMTSFQARLTAMVFMWQYALYSPKVQYPCLFLTVQERSSR